MIVHKSWVHHTTADAFLRRPDTNAELMDGGSPGAVCFQVHKATQTGTEHDPSTVWAIDFPAPIAAPVEDSGRGTGPDRFLICAPPRWKLCDSVMWDRLCRLWSLDGSPWPRAGLGPCQKHLLLAHYVW